MKNDKLKLLLLLVVFPQIIFCQKVYQYPFQNTALSVDERVNDLVGHLTLEEKISQTMDISPAISRLDIPKCYWWNEALHGVARAGIATVFPQAIGLAATWDTALIFQMADIISTEARAKFHQGKQYPEIGHLGGLTIWSPNINIFRDPRWGRGQETYGEDPYLTSRIGVAFVKGLQGNDSKYLKTIATPKHYAVHSGPEPSRHAFNAITNQRDFLETYSPAFEALIREGGAWSIMGAYNRYMNDPCCASPYLLQQVLRDQWKFKGYVVSDCDAIADIWRDHKTVKTDAEAAAIAVKAGCDLNCGTTYKALNDAVQQGLVTEKDIDVIVKRLFEARFRLGLFDPPGIVKYANIPISAVDTRVNREVALKAAHESMVLLKNDHLLPLSKNLKSIAVIGPNANNAKVMYGNYNGTPSKSITPLDGIKNKVPDIKIQYVKGCNWASAANQLEVVPPEVLSYGEKQGLHAEYFANRNLKDTPTVVRVDKRIDFDWIVKPPKGMNKTTDISMRWTGKLTVPETGKYTFAITADDGYKLFIDNKLIFEEWQNQPETTSQTEIELTGGKSCDIKIEYYQAEGEGTIKFEYALNKGQDPMKEALGIASQSDVVLFFGGISPFLEGEEMKVNYDGFLGGDRTRTDLPAIQDSLLKMLYDTGKPVVLVLMSGSALSVNWADQNIPAILQSWYPGEEGGTAIADILFGDYNPSGRLPITFYKSAGQLPPFENYAMNGRTYRYFKGDVLYPFGYGLSYTKFTYNKLEMPKSVKTGDPVTITAEVSNTGNIEGDEIVQMYVSISNASVPVPIRSLQGFSRVHLKPGEKKVVSYTLMPRQLSVVDDNASRIEQPGLFEISIGGGQPLKNQQFISGVFTVTGTAIVIR